MRNPFETHTRVENERARTLSRLSASLSYDPLCTKRSSTSRKYRSLCEFSDDSQRNLSGLPFDLACTSEISVEVFKLRRILI